MQDYYLEALGASRNRVMYLTPPARYIYQAPPRVTDGHGKMRKAGDRKTAPFPSFWYLDPEPALTAHSLLLAWRERRLGAASNCQLCLGTRQLPHKMRDAFDPLRKKLSKREREKMRKKTAADGRKLCKQCGQVRGLAYGMVFNVGHLLRRFCFFLLSWHSHLQNGRRPCAGAWPLQAHSASVNLNRSCAAVRPPHSPRLVIRM